MYFDPTPQSVTSLLVIVIAVFAFHRLVQGQFDTNLPLTFYTATIMAGSFTEQTVHPYILITGIAFAMVLRFEFMSKGFTRFMGVLTGLAIGASVLALVEQIFGGTQIF
jgi:hypothetical protein